MDLYGKSLIYVVFLIILLMIIQFLITKYSPNKNIENFQNIKSTFIRTMTPIEGDSSTIVTLTGVGFNNVSKIYLKIGNAHAQCVILDNRGDEKIEILPPPVTELGKNLLDIRNSITNSQGRRPGLKTQIVFVSGDYKSGTDDSLSIDDKNVITVKNLNFYYIDRLPYQNNCVVPPEPPAETSPEPVQSDELPDEIEIEYPEGSDLEFLNKILPEKEEKINKLVNKLKNIYDKYDSNLTNQNTIDVLTTSQAIESLDEMKKQFNYERYMVTEYLRKNYIDKHSQKK